MQSCLTFVLWIHTIHFITSICTNELLFFSLVNRLGVPSLPFGHIYHPTGGLVEEAKISKKFFPNFSRAVNNYVEGACDLEEYNEPGEKMP